MPRLSFLVSDQTANAVRECTEKFCVTQQQLIEVIMEDLQLTPAQVNKLVEIGTKRVTDRKSVQRALRALEGLSEEQINAILLAARSKETSDEKGNPTA